MVVKLEITTQKRTRGNTVRPALSVYYEIWNFFCLKYPKKEHRNKIIEDLIVEQLENEVVSVPEIKINLS